MDSKFTTSTLIHGGDTEPKGAPANVSVTETPAHCEGLNQHTILIMLFLIDELFFSVLQEKEAGTSRVVVCESPRQRGN